MNKQLLSALLLLAVCVIIMLVNRGSVGVNLIVGEISAMKSLVFLAFTGMGVVIGVLLK